jgi:poly(A) polymerase
VYLHHNYVSKYKNYRETLKAIKMWAKKKGIYSQIYGYLGGAAISIMLAKICQLYPNYSCLQLIDRFFFIYANWVWTIPVMLEKMDYMERLDSEMIVFTPLEPHMNAGYYISKITCNITKKHFRLASKCIQEINKGNKSWKDLFQPLNFFEEYKNFLEISVMGQKIDDFIPWRGAVESKIRKLIQIIEEQS